MSENLHDPGGKVRLQMLPDTAGAASFSPCGKYRHWLSRSWSKESIRPFALFIGMNPSTASADFDDPTIRREIAFCKRWGISSYFKYNVMDYRSTNPKMLRGPDARSAGNLDRIRAQAVGAEKVVACWGVIPTPLHLYGLDTAGALLHDGVELWCFGTTANGSPRHPLYLKSDSELMRFRP